MPEKVGYKDNNEWLSLRKNFIGGSDIVNIIDLDIKRYGSPLMTWYDKTNPDYITPMNKSMWWGHKLEPAVADYVEEFSEELFGEKKKVRNENHILIDDEIPFFAANIDRKIVGEDAILECKTTNSMNKAEWEGKHIPDAYYCQLQWYLGITHYEKAYIACLMGDKDIIFKSCGRDEEFITYLRRQAFNFWTKYVIPKVEPPATANDSELLKHLYDDNEEEKDLSECMDLFINRTDIIKDIDKIKVELAVKETLLKSLDNQIIQSLQGSQKGFCGNFEVTNKLTVSTILDSTKIKKECPEIYEKYGKKSERRTFKIKEINNV